MSLHSSTERTEQEVDTACVACHSTKATATPARLLDHRCLWLQACTHQQNTTREVKNSDSQKAEQQGPGP